MGRMKNFLTVILMLAVVCGAAAFDLPFPRTMEQAAREKAPSVNWLDDGGQVVLEVGGEALNNDSYGYIRKIDLKPYAGKFVRFRADIAAENVSAPAIDCHGVKFMISYICSDATKLWPAGADGVSGSFDFRPFEFFFYVPENIDSATLTLGLQGVSGTVKFKNLEAEVFEMFPPVCALPDGFRCEYDSRVTGDVMRRGVMSPFTPDITGQDMRDLAGWGANLIRWQIGKPATPEENHDPALFRKWYETELKRLDDFLPLCDSLGIKVIIDMHSPPGGRYRDPVVLGTAGGEADKLNAKGTTEFQMFNDDVQLEAFIELWRDIARRYKGNPAVWAYDLVNEPVQNIPVKTDYLKCQYLAAQAVREIDPDTPIIIESNNWCSPAAYAYMQPLPLKNILYQVHMYDPGEYTHQGVHPGMKVDLAYPGTFYGEYYDKARLQKSLSKAREFELEYGAKMFVGEFSVIRWAPNGAQYLEDVLGILEDYRWPWCYHAFREWDGWSVEHGAVRADTNPVADTDRKQVLLKYLQRNGK